MNKETVLKIFKTKNKKHNLSLHLLPIELQKDEDIAIAALSSGFQFSNLHPSLWSNLKVACVAIKKPWWTKSLALIPEEIQRTPEFMIASLGNTTLAAWSELSEEEKNNKEFFLKAIHVNSKAYQFASPTLQNDKDIILTLINKAPSYIAHISSQFQNDKDVVLLAIKKNPKVIKLVKPQFLDDRDVIINVVKHQGNLLSCASERLRDDEEIVLKALKSCSRSLYDASLRLKDKEEIVEIASLNLCPALQYASERLKNDLEFVFKLSQKNIANFHHCGSELKKQLGHSLEPLKDMQKLIDIRKEKELLEMSTHHIENNITKKKMKI